MKKILLSVLVLATILISCTKETTAYVDQAFSDVTDIIPSDWVANADKTSYAAELSFPEIDETRYQFGAVLVYLRFGTDKFYQAIPQVFNGISYGVTHENGFVVVDIHKVNGGVVTPPNQTITAKVVVIDASEFAMKKDNVNLKDFSAVQKAFNVK